VVRVETLLSVPGCRIAYFDEVSDLEGRTEHVGRSVEYDPVAPAHGEHVVISGRTGSPCPQFVEPRLWVCRKQALGFSVQPLDLVLGEQGWSDHEPKLVEGSQLVRIGVTAQRNLAEFTEGGVEPLRFSLSQVLTAALAHRRMLP
jgi:hypothetical protein